MGAKALKKFKKLEIVVFEPKGSLENTKAYKDHPLKPGERVLYLGDIPNVPGHCCVAKKDGAVIWLVHPEDFRTATDEEL